MYSLKDLTEWFKSQIDSELDEVYALIKHIIIGFAIGLAIAWSLCAFVFPKASFLAVITKVSGLGISLTTIISIFYYLYKGDEIETRKSNFLGHIYKQLDKSAEQGINLYVEKKVVEEIIMSLLKSSISEANKFKSEDDKQSKENEKTKKTSVKKGEIKKPGEVEANDILVDGNGE